MIHMYYTGTQLCCTFCKRRELRVGLRLRLIGFFLEIFFFFTQLHSSHHLASAKTNTAPQYFINIVTIYDNNHLKGLVATTEVRVPQKYFLIDLVDREEGTAMGTKITMFALFISNLTDSIELLKLQDMMYQSQQPLVAASISTDYNDLDEAIEDSNSLFRSSQYVLLVGSITGLLHSIIVTSKLYIESNRTLPFQNFCTWSLLVTVVANVVRVVRSCDVMGFVGVIPYFIARPLYTLPIALLITCSLGTFFFWMEAASQIQHSLNMRFTRRKKRLKVAAFLLSLLVIAAEVCISSLSVLGKIYGTVMIVPMVYFITMSLVISGSIFTVRKRKISSLSSSPLHSMHVPILLLSLFLSPVLCRRHTR
jgi:hypothetical protein